MPVAGLQCMQLLPAANLQQLHGCLMYRLVGVLAELSHNLHELQISQLLDADIVKLEGAQKHLQAELH